MTYRTQLRFHDLSDLLDDYYYAQAILTAHAERVAAGTNTPADNRQAARTAAWNDAITAEIVKRAEKGQR